METNDNSFKIVSIDPGTDALGLAILDVSFDNFEIIKTRASTIIASKLVSEDSWLAQVHNYRTARIYKLKEILLKRFIDLEPAIVVCESPFFNPRRPGAFAPLVEILAAIRGAVIEYDSWKPLNLIDPSTIKKSVNAPGNADKTVVKKCVMALTDINFDGDVPIEDLDEHSYDAIAVGYCHVKFLKQDSNRIKGNF